MRKIPRLWNDLDSGAIMASDVVAISVSVLLMCLLTILFSGCAEVGQFRADDAHRATVVARVVGDSASAAR